MLPSGRSIAPLQMVHGNTGSLTNAAAFTTQSVDVPAVPPREQLASRTAYKRRKDRESHRQTTVQSGTAKYFTGIRADPEHQQTDVASRKQPRPTLV